MPNKRKPTKKYAYYTFRFDTPRKKGRKLKVRAFDIYDAGRMVKRRYPKATKLKLL